MTLLANSNSKARRFRFRGNRDLQATLAELTQAAAIIRAVFFERLPADPNEQLETIRDKIRGINIYASTQVSPDGKSRLEQVIDQIESGYNVGTNPYGNSFESRPRIRILDETETE